MNIVVISRNITSEMEDRVRQAVLRICPDQLAIVTFIADSDDLGLNSLFHQIGEHSPAYVFIDPSIGQRKLGAIHSWLCSPLVIIHEIDNDLKYGIVNHYDLRFGWYWEWHSLNPNDRSRIFSYVNMIIND